MPEYRMFRIRVEDHKKLKVLAAQRDESMLDTFSAALNSLKSEKKDDREAVESFKGSK